MLIDQFHIDILVPRDMPPRLTQAITKTLNSKAFRQRLSSNIRAVVRQFPTLERAKFRLSR